MQEELDRLTALIVSAAEAKKGEDLVILDLQPLEHFADRFIIAGAQSRVHLRAIADEVWKVLKEKAGRQAYLEGCDSSSWILFECGGVVLHLFSGETREFYALERLWADAPRLEASKYATPPER